MIYHNVKKAEKYARDVINGKIITNKWIKLACQRHFGDKELSKNKDYPYQFDADKAEKLAKFIQLLPHTKGKWAAKGEKIKLEPWQLFACCLPFGWVKKSDGLRRYRKILIFVCRKNGKSAIAAGLTNYMFCADGEFGAEVYSGATTEKQAWEVLDQSKLWSNAPHSSKNIMALKLMRQT